MIKNISKEENTLGIAAAALAAIAVAAGAIGAHLLEHKLPENALQTFETAVKYQFYHALAILVLIMLPLAYSKWVARFFIAGIILFSGSLYVYSLSWLFTEYGFGPAAIGAPFGGLCFIIGWIILVIKFKQQKNDN